MISLGLQGAYDVIDAGDGVLLSLAELDYQDKEVGSYGLGGTN